MDILTMKKEDFEKVPFRNAETNLDDFYSAVIIPAEDMHDSGYRCMDFVAVNSSKEPICRLSGCSDVLDIDGIGGYGLNGVLSDKVDNKAWKIDCLPCGYLRIFPRFGYKLQADSIPVSDFSLYAVKIVEDIEEVGENKKSKYKKAKWIKGAYWSEGCGMGEVYGNYYKCSNCKKEVQDNYEKCSLKYCPYCGKRMDGDVNE